MTQRARDTVPQRPAPEDALRDGAGPHEADFHNGALERDDVVGSPVAADGLLETAPPDARALADKTPAGPASEDRPSKRRMPRGRRRKRRAVETEHLDAADALQAEHGPASWTGPVELPRRLPGLLLTLGAGVGLITGSGERLRTTFVRGSDILWLDPHGRAVTIGLRGHDDLAPKGELKLTGRSTDLFAALVRVPRARREPTTLPPKAVAPKAVAAPRQGATVTRVPAPNRRRHVGPRGGNAEPVGRLVTRFAPTAYVEHADGVLRPCRWASDDDPPPVGARVELAVDDDGWSASPITEMPR